MGGQGRWLIGGLLLGVLSLGTGRGAWAGQAALAGAQDAVMGGGQPLVPCVVDAAQLGQCMSACSAGGSSLRGFCASIPDPRVRAICYGLELGSEVACRNFCAWHFGR